MLERENVVALCDVNSKALAAAAQKFPQSEAIQGLAKMPGPERPGCGALLHPRPSSRFHFRLGHESRACMYIMEKPLANTVEEARMVRDTYMKHKSKLATQTGTQRHFDPNFALHP